MHTYSSDYKYCNTYCNYFFTAEILLQYIFRYHWFGNSTGAPLSTFFSFVKYFSFQTTKQFKQQSG